MKRRGFTLIELLVVIAIIGILASLLMPALAKAKRKARMIEEISSAKQLLIAVNLYAADNNEAAFPGYASLLALDDRGQPTTFPENARYPWRIVPYLSQSMEVIYCADNRARLNQLREINHDDFVYRVSLYPSLGINSYFIGGNETEFPASQANKKFGANTVVTKLSQVKSTAGLMAFVSARSAVDGDSANGYYQVTPPYTAGRKWAAECSPGLPPEQWGFVALRFQQRAVAALLDGHVESFNANELQDMRHWCNTADRPDFILQPTP